jgi:hypothetical protein
MSFDHSIEHFRPGFRVELHPVTDRWMMGDRYGTVTKIGTKLLYIQLDRSGLTIRVHPSNIGQIIPSMVEMRQ